MIWNKLYNKELKNNVRAQPLTKATPSKINGANATSSTMNKLTTCKGFIILLKKNMQKAWKRRHSLRWSTVRIQQTYCLPRHHEPKRLPIQETPVSVSMCRLHLNKLGVWVKHIQIITIGKAERLNWRSRTSPRQLLLRTITTQEPALSGYLCLKMPKCKTFTRTLPKWVIWWIEHEYSIQFVYSKAITVELQWDYYKKVE